MTALAAMDQSDKQLYVEVFAGVPISRPHEMVAR